MKKALFLVIASVVLVSCGGHAPAEEAAKTDSTAVAAAVDTAAVATTSVAVADTAKAVEAVK